MPAVAPRPDRTPSVHALSQHLTEPIMAAGTACDRSRRHR
jgi:hypothetical protein